MQISRQNTQVSQEMLPRIQSLQGYDVGKTWPFFIYKAGQLNQKVPTQPLSYTMELISPSCSQFERSFYMDFFYWLLWINSFLKVEASFKNTHIRLLMNFSLQPSQPHQKLHIENRKKNKGRILATCLHGSPKWWTKVTAMCQYDLFAKCLCRRGEDELKIDDLQLLVIENFLINNLVWAGEQAKQTCLYDFSFSSCVSNLVYFKIRIISLHLLSHNFSDKLHSILQLEKRCNSLLPIQRFFCSNITLYKKNYCWFDWL